MRNAHVNGWVWQIVNCEVKLLSHATMEFSIADSLADSFIT